MRPYAEIRSPKRPRPSSGSIRPYRMSNDMYDSILLQQPPLVRHLSDGYADTVRRHGRLMDVNDRSFSSRNLGPLDVDRIEISDTGRRSSRRSSLVNVLGIPSIKWCLHLNTWRGRLANSYFAWWLFWSSLTIVLIDIVALLAEAILVAQDQGLETSTACRNVVQEFQLIHWIGLANLTLGIPAVFPRQFKLYRLQRRKVIRTPFLHICELLVVAEFVTMIFYAVNVVVVNREVKDCFETYDLMQLVQVALGVIVWVLVYVQIVVFSRFRAHLKLQLGSLDDSGHSANIKGWMKRLMTLPTCSARDHRAKELRTLIYKATGRGDYEAVQTLIEEAQQVLGKDFSSKMYPSPRLWLWAVARSAKNPLHIACAHGDQPMAELLISSGFQVNTLDKVSRVSFSIGQLFKITRRLVSTQDRLKSRFHDVLTSVLVSPLHVAVVNGHVLVVKLLLSHGADVDILPKTSFYCDQTLAPIFIAEHPQVLELLLQHGANHLASPGSHSYRGNARTVTALQRNLLEGRSGVQFVLEDWGGDYALTPLHAAAAAGDTAMIALLIKRGADVSSTGECVPGMSSRTPLHWAAIVGQAPAAQLLIENNSDPNQRDRYGRSPLHWATRNNHVQVVQLLLASGADPNMRDEDGCPPICVAAQMEGIKEELLMLLVSHGADINAVIYSGNTALHVALLRENRETGVALLKCGADIMKMNYNEQRAVDCTTSTEIQYAVKRQAGHRDVMISYSHAHSHFAHRVREAIEAHGITCWMDTMDPSGIGGGSIWRQEIARGIDHAAAVLAIVCGSYGRSSWCLKELSYAKLTKTPGRSRSIHQNALSQCSIVIGMIAEYSAMSEEIDVGFYSFFSESFMTFVALYSPRVSR